MAEKKTVATDNEPTLMEKVDEFLGVLKRRYWWILGSVFVIPIAVIAAAMTLPNHYTSQATLLSVQPIVARYVEGEAPASVTAVFQAMELQVLTRGRLLEIINDLGLYSDKRQLSPELLIDQMRKDLDIKPAVSASGHSDANAFVVAFTARTPATAQAVTRRLTSLFVEQNLKNRGEQASETAKFLTRQMDGAKARLMQQEERLDTFRASNMGQLPEQQQVNLAALADVRTQLGVINANLLQAQKEQASIRSSMEMSAADHLNKLQTEREQLLTRYTEKYPEVAKKDREIAQARALLERVTTSNTAPEKIAIDDLPENAALIGFSQQAEANAAQIESLNKQAEKLKAQSDEYQARLNAAPVREKQVTEIMRDQELLRQDYANLERQRLQSQMAAAVEQNKQGQQFQVVDPPSLPVKPVSPNRLKIALGALAAGILIGFLLAFVMESRDSSFHSEAPLSWQFALPLVMGVPLVRTHREALMRRWRIAFECVAGSLMVLAVLAAEFYVFKNG
jgi:polysaccharide chain length determinant protein (PEP-CTERM system associated)